MSGNSGPERTGCRTSLTDSTTSLTGGCGPASTCSSSTSEPFASIRTPTSQACHAQPAWSSLPVQRSAETPVCLGTAAEATQLCDCRHHLTRIPRRPCTGGENTLYVAAPPLGVSETRGDPHSF